MEEVVFGENETQVSRCPGCEHLSTTNADYDGKTFFFCPNVFCNVEKFRVAEGEPDQVWEFGDSAKE